MRRITVVLDVALETEAATSAQVFGDVLAEEIELMLPRVSVWLGQEHGFDWADVTRVSATRASEQE